MEFWDVIRLPSQKKRCEVPLLWSKVQLVADGSSHGKEVVVLDGAKHFGGPALRQVDDLKCEFTGLGRECVGDCEIKWKLNTSLPDNQL